MCTWVIGQLWSILVSEVGKPEASCSESEVEGTKGRAQDESAVTEAGPGWAGLGAGIVCSPGRRVLESGHQGGSALVNLAASV